MFGQNLCFLVKRLICFLFTDIRGERSKPDYAQLERKTGQVWDGKKTEHSY